MIRQVFQQKFREYQSKGLYSPITFIDYVSNDMSIDKDVVKQILEATPWYQEIRQNIKQLVKEAFNEWRTIPVQHDHESFVRYITNTFGITNEELASILKNADWYIKL